VDALLSARGAEGEEFVYTLMVEATRRLGVNGMSGITLLLDSICQRAPWSTVRTV